MAPEATTVTNMLVALRDVLPEPWKVELDRLVVAAREAWERRQTLTEAEYQQLLEQWFALGVAAGMHGPDVN
jgi:hypothetical protein